MKCYTNCPKSCSWEGRIQRVDFKKQSNDKYHRAPPAGRALLGHTPVNEARGPNLLGRTLDSSRELSTEQDVVTKDRSPLSEPGNQSDGQSLQAAWIAKRLMAREAAQAGPIKGPTTFGRRVSGGCVIREPKDPLTGVTLTFC